jgi:hypothetical protein
MKESKSFRKLFVQDKNLWRGAHISILNLFGIDLNLFGNDLVHNVMPIHFDRHD